MTESSDESGKRVVPTTSPSSASLCAWTPDGQVTVLIVDDEPSIRHILGAQLRKRGMAVIEASNGHEALAALSVRRFDLLITDLQMPVMDGAALLVLAHDQYPLVRSIVMTGYTTLENALDALKLGAIGFMPKPVDAAILDKLVDLALAEIRLWRTQLIALRRMRTKAT